MVTPVAARYKISRMESRECNNRPSGPSVFSCSSTPLPRDPSAALSVTPPTVHLSAARFPSTSKRLRHDEHGREPRGSMAHASSTATQRGREGRGVECRDRNACLGARTPASGEARLSTDWASTHFTTHSRGCCWGYACRTVARRRAGQESQSRGRTHVAVRLGQGTFNTPSAVLSAHRR